MGKGEMGQGEMGQGEMGQGEMDGTGGDGWDRGRWMGQGEMGQGDVDGVTHRVTCTWWLLWQAVEMAWLGLSGPILALVAQMLSENTTLTLQGLHFWHRRQFGVRMGVFWPRMLTIASLLMSGRG